MENIEQPHRRTGELAPGNPPLTAVRDSAEENRTNLREIYGDVLGLVDAATASTDAEIGFHFYEGLAKLVRKMQGAVGHPLYQLWAAAEELRFLFDAHAVWISVPEEHRRAPEDIAPVDVIWEVATLTEEEKRLIGPVRKGEFTGQLPPRKASGVRWDILDHPLGELQKEFAKNSNLASVDGVLNTAS